MLTYDQCILLINQLHADKKISLKDSEELKRAIEMNVANFPKGLLARYKVKVASYLKTATIMLRFSPPLAALKEKVLPDHIRYYAEN